MVRTHLFFKVEVEHDPRETPERIGQEICRRQGIKALIAGRIACFRTSPMKDSENEGVAPIV